MLDVELVSKLTKGRRYQGGYPIWIAVNKCLSTIAAGVGNQYVSYYCSAWAVSLVLGWGVLTRC